MCDKHYMRLWRHGSPFAVKKFPPDTPNDVRFWAGVPHAKGEPWPEHCLDWSRRRDWGGYGILDLQGQVEVRAHVYAYELHYGMVPEGLHVLHSCDNPPCVNPRHLRAGTHAENMRDKAVRGRATGKLTADQVRAIRADTERSGRAVARDYGVSEQTIWNIRYGRTYRWVT